MDTFKNLFNRFPNDISLCLLGGPIGSYGQQILRKCKKMKEKGHDIQFFEGFVPEEMFSTILMESTVVVSPTKLESRGLGVIKEIYGVSKASGVLYEAVQYEKPLVVPSELKIMKEMESSTLKYNDPEDLENILAEIIEDRVKLEDFEHRAYKNSQLFSLELLQDYFVNEILNKLDKL